MEVKNEIYEVGIYCPKCKSKDVVYRYAYNSIYGALPSKDFCKTCGFKDESFYLINISEIRDNKLKDILGDGI